MGEFNLSSRLNVTARGLMGALDTAHIKPQNVQCQHLTCEQVNNPLSYH